MNWIAWAAIGLMLILIAGWTIWASRQPVPPTSWGE